MLGRKLTGANKKDFRVTVRLDPETYRSLSEAVKQGAIRNVSEALREMIRQKLWAEKCSREMQRDLKLNEVSDQDLRRVKKILLGDYGTSENRRLLAAGGFLEGMFSALGGIVRKAVIELERRENTGKVTRSKRKGTSERSS